MAGKKKRATAAKRPAKKRTRSPETVLILRTTDKEGRSHGGFQWPETGPVECPDWDRAPRCGNGLHGWLWGAGDWSLKSKGESIKWKVVEVLASDVVDIDGSKVKFPKGNVLATFTAWADAMAVIRDRALKAVENKAVATEPREIASATGDYGHASATGYYGHASATGNSGHASATGYSGHASATGNSGHASATGNSGHASATGNYGHASATGYSGHASATGDYGHASATGDYGHASATGYSGHASATGNSGHASATGDNGHASATGDTGHASATGYSGHASATGNYGWAIAGYGGRAKANDNGVLTLLWWDEKSKRPRVAVGYVGEDGIEADTYYEVVNGKLAKVSR